MSAAPEFAPAVYIPQSARTCPPPRRLATVTHLYRPSQGTIAPPVRLTRRGVVVLAVGVAVLGAALMMLAWLSAPASAGGSGGSGARMAAVPAHITVGPGDTLWSIATRIAPDRDPRAEVADLVQVNSLGNGPLIPGQVLRTR